MTLRSSVEDLDGIPIIRLRESPLVGLASVQKRAFDLATTSTMLVLAAPLIGLIALAVWASSGAVKDSLDFIGFPGSGLCMIGLGIVIFVLVTKVMRRGDRAGSEL